MISLTKQDLYYCDYTWTDYLPNSPKISGRLDTTRFNRMEGNEVLYLINKITQMWDFTKLESCLRMERIIREKLPATILTQEDVATWIQINWKTITLKELI
jgi:hypothetical protein